MNCGIYNGCIHFNNLEKKEEGTQMEITVNLENLSTDERGLLLKLVEKANTQPSKIWKPSSCETYYTLSSDGEFDQWDWDDDTTDRDRLAIGNCFKTKEGAVFVRERLKVIHELKVAANGFNPLKERADGFILGYDLTFKKVKPVDTHGSGYVFDEIQFQTESQAENAIKQIGEGRLKKYYFCIED